MLTICASRPTSRQQVDDSPVIFATGTLWGNWSRAVWLCLPNNMSLNLCTDFKRTVYDHRRDKELVNFRSLTVKVWHKVTNRLRNEESYVWFISFLYFEVKPCQFFVMFLGAELGCPKENL